MWQCIAAMSSLNLTVSNGNSSYIQLRYPTLHDGGTLTSPYTSVMPLNQSSSLYKISVKHKLGPSHAQQEDASPEPSGGLCSVLIEGPPGKLLSLLFLTHTCSHENHVHVQDPHDGWSTTLDGCSLWRSPGYDVTTASRSAVLVIHVQNLKDVFTLNVQLTAVVPTTNALMTRYVSGGLGYIQTQGWHPFTRPFLGKDVRNQAIKINVPANHATLISVVHNYFFRTKLASVKLFTSSRTHHVWKLSYSKRPDVVLENDLTMFCVHFDEVRGYFIYGVRVLFSFHEPISAPHRSPDGLWNCSSPSWTAFLEHFVCNNKTECSGREDEIGCPETSCKHGDGGDTLEGVQLNGVCYVFILLPKEKDTWFHANTACKRLNAALASFPTVNSWYDLALLGHTKTGDEYIYIGLQTPAARYPHMYRHLLQWHNGSLSLFAAYRQYEGPPACFHVFHNQLDPLSCASRPKPEPRHKRRIPDAHALCQTTPRSVVNVPRARKSATNKTKQMQSNIRQNFSFPFRLISCPDQHFTHEYLAYHKFSECCCQKDGIMSGDVNFVDCVDVGVTSFKALFPCRNGAGSVPYSVVCDHLQDCQDNSDEGFCVFPACLQYACANGQCIPIHHHCNEIVQCFDETDEVDCISSQFRKGYLEKLDRPPVIADFDGAGWIIYTSLTSRSNGELVCPDTHLLCHGDDGYCLPVYVWCNDLFDCPGPDYEDEADCKNRKCPGMYRCRGRPNTCLYTKHLCDDIPQCTEYHDDEMFCNLTFTCPVHCTCLGDAFQCTQDFAVEHEHFSNLRYLDARDTGLRPGRLVNNKMLVYLSLANCGLTHLDNLTLSNLISLDLSDNRFSFVAVAELNLLKNLQNLSLARNPLFKLFSGNTSSGNPVRILSILHVDVTGLELHVLDVRSNLPFPKLRSLNLSQSQVTRLIGDGFKSLTSLRILDLRGCPMTVFPRRAFKDLKKLDFVFAENHKVCCESSLPDSFNVGNCQAPFDEITSCEALLRADVYRVCLSMLAILALSGNLGCFSLRIFSLSSRSKTGFNVFVAHLCLSDFVMGVYMATIGVADRLYLGRYLWEEARWRHSAACQVAGVLALLSSEVSAFIICLITVDRFLVIRFPFSRLRFSSFSAQIASLLTWAVGVALVTVPFLPVTEYSHFYGQTGICIPLPIARNDFAGHEYAFGVMILLNLIVFLIIAAGQLSVYMSITSNAMSSIDTTRKSRDLIVARRLLTVVVSDFLCWFPLGLLGVLAAHGVSVPGEVNVAMAIFVLPLNSALNPFLYTLNIILEKRQRAIEAKLLKMIMDRGMNDIRIVNKE